MKRPQRSVFSLTCSLPMETRDGGFFFASFRGGRAGPFGLEGKDVFVRTFRNEARSDGLFLLRRHFGPEKTGNGLILNGD